jgi:hypothetical protein
MDVYELHRSRGELNYEALFKNRGRLYEDRRCHRHKVVFNVWKLGRRIPHRRVRCEWRQQLATHAITHVSELSSHRYIRKTVY